MIIFKCTVFAVSVPMILCSINERLSGWLDRVVEFQKKSFIDDLMKNPKQIKFSARLERAPPGYVDSTAWDFDSVIHLLTLIRDSEGAAPVRRVFRRAFITKTQDWPWDELQLNSLNDDDDEWGEYYAEPVPLKGFQNLEELDSGVIVVENPVEAKLPSARISVALLKTILQSRASAGRQMPTTQLNISWPVTPKRSRTTKSESTDAESTASTASAEATTTESATNGTVTASNETAVVDTAYADTNKTVT